jgi:ABC-2 type transport system ATP-binding protein
LPPHDRARIGYLAEGHPAYGWMRVKDAAAFQSRFYPKWNRKLFNSVLEFFRVAPGTRARNLSRGERAGLCLAMTLAPEPELLILDDPAIGLDPVARRSLLESMVYATRKSDRTIIFSSHLLADIERMADHIAVLDYSVMRAQCSLETFRSCVQQFVLTFAGKPPDVPPIRGLIQCIARSDQLRLTLVNVTRETRTALDALGAVAIAEVPISLEDAFVSYLGGRLENAQLPETLEPELAGGVS